MSLIPALLVWLNLEAFEILAHEIEYCNEITMSFVDLVLLASLVKQQSGKSFGDNCSSFLFPLIATAISIFQILIYNCMGRKPDGGMVGEKLAHYCEFSFEIMSAAIVFWFCVDNKVVADREIDEIMYGDHRDCAVCHIKSVELQNLRSHSAMSSYTQPVPNTKKKGRCKKGCKHTGNCGV